MCQIRSKRGDFPLQQAGLQEKLRVDVQTGWRVLASMAMWPFWGGKQEDDLGADKGKKKKAKKLTPRQVP